jgi:hemolysin activation/secretion protein
MFKSWPPLAALLVFALSGHAIAEPLERNLPAVPKTPPSELDVPPLPGSIDDDRSLGVNLKAIVALAPTSSVLRGPVSPGVDLKQVSRLDTGDAHHALEPFLGQPISRKLIAEVKAAIVDRYRDMGYPFVEVSTPEQEITQGVLQIRVVEFHIGKIDVPKADPAQAAYIIGNLSLAPGDAIDAPALLQDLDWLNRYPYRLVEPTFKAGASLGAADLDLSANYPKSWTIDAGYANSGSPASGEDRYFLGGSVSGHVLTDELLSVQITGSPNFWSPQGKMFPDLALHPQYESAAARLNIATFAKQDIEFTLNLVESNEPVFPLVVRQQTEEFTAGYRSALSNIMSILPGEISGGVEISRQFRNSFFGDTIVLKGALNIYQVYADWSDHWSGWLGATTVDLGVHYSPGNLDAHNAAINLFYYSNGRVSSARYAYGAANMNHAIDLPLGFSLVTQFNGQYAGVPLPDSQQIVLGGQTAVRGYNLDDGAFDDGAVLRDELHLPPLNILSDAPYGVILAGRIFADIGYGRNEATRLNTRFAAAGFGADLQITSYLLASFDVSRAMIGAKTTTAGSSQLDARVTIAY